MPSVKSVGRFQPVDLLVESMLCLRKDDVESRLTSRSASGHRHCGVRQSLSRWLDQGTPERPFLAGIPRTCGQLGELHIRDPSDFVSDPRLYERFSESPRVVQISVAC